MLAVVTLPTTFCQLRSENVHQEAVGPGFESPHLHSLDLTPQPARTHVSAGWL